MPPPVVVVLDVVGVLVARVELVELVEVVDELDVLEALAQHKTQHHAGTGLPLDRQQPVEILARHGQGLLQE